MTAPPLASDTQGSVSRCLQSSKKIGKERKVTSGCEMSHKWLIDLNRIPKQLYVVSELLLTTVYGSAMIVTSSFSPLTDCVSKSCAAAQCARFICKTRTIVWYRQSAMGSFSQSAILRPLCTFVYGKIAHHCHRTLARRYSPAVLFSLTSIVVAFLEKKVMIKSLNEKSNRITSICNVTTNVHAVLFIPLSVFAS